MKRIKFLIVEVLLTLGMSFSAKSQVVESYSVTFVSGSTWHFKVVLDQANPNGRGVIGGWNFGWAYDANHFYDYTGGAFIMGPTGGTTYESDQDVNQWRPAEPPIHFFSASHTSPDGPVAFICDICLTGKNK